MRAALFLSFNLLLAGLMLAALGAPQPAIANATLSVLKQQLFEIDAKLNREYQTLRKSRAPAARKVLLNEQKKWLKRRDDTCKIVGLPDQREQWIARIATNLEQAKCVIDKTKFRIASLVENQKSSSSVVFDFRSHGEIVEQSVRDIAKNSGFSLTNESVDNVCKTFFDDFIEDRNIFHIRPIIETDNYNDTLLSPYKENCPLKSQDLRTTFYVSVHDQTDYSEVDEIPEYADVFIGQDNYKIYKLRIDDNDSEDILFYYENQLHVKSNKIGPGRIYRSYTSDSCRSNRNIHFNQYGSQLWTRNGVLSYKGQNGIYVMESGKKTQTYFSIVLYMYSQKREKLNTLCRYSRPLK